MIKMISTKKIASLFSFFLLLILSLGLVQADLFPSDTPAAVRGAFLIDGAAADASATLEVLVGGTVSKAIAGDGSGEYYITIGGSDGDTVTVEVCGVEQTSFTFDAYSTTVFDIDTDCPETTTDTTDTTDTADAAAGGDGGGGGGGGGGFTVDDSSDEDADDASATGATGTFSGSTAEGDENLPPVIVDVFNEEGDGEALFGNSITGAITGDGTQGSGNLLTGALIGSSVEFLKSNWLYAGLIGLVIVGLLGSLIVVRRRNKA